jgi:hypothetical protein
VTTVSKRTAASADDAFDHTPGFIGYSHTTTLWTGKSNNQSLVLGARFLTVDIPSGATVNSATLTLVDDAFEGATHLGDAGCEDSASPATFSSGASPKARTMTAARLSSQTVTEPAVDASWTSGNFAASVQELVDSYGAITNLVVLLDGAPAANGTFNHWYSFDTDSTKAPLLDLDYTAGGGGGAAPPRRRLGLLGTGR